MIKFFRKIRQNLISEGKTVKYLKYAIGEIMLVVIGILIALQVNNWNENRKLKVEEIKVLKELREDLIQSIMDVGSDSTYFSLVIKSNNIIIEQIEKELPYHDSLEVYFFNLAPFATFSLNQTTYEKLKNTGHSIISNDSLEKNISNFYTSDLNLYKEMEKRVLIEHYENYLKPMFINQFISFKRQSTKPRNYHDFIHNADNLQILNYTVFVCTQVTRLQGFLVKTMKHLIHQIDKEIELKL